MLLHPAVGVLFAGSKNATAFGFKLFFLKIIQPCISWMSPLPSAVAWQPRLIVCLFLIERVPAPELPSCLHEGIWNLIPHFLSAPTPRGTHLESHCLCCWPHIIISFFFLLASSSEFRMQKHRTLPNSRHHLI